jgi:transmembrane sensor
MSAGESATDPDLNSIDLEALRWLHILERNPLSDDQRRQFNAWVAADIRHRGALIRARAAGLHLNRLAALAGGRSVFESPKPSIITRRRMMAAMAVPAAGVLGLLSWEGRGWLGDFGGDTRYACDIGEVKKVVLPDGSLMTLNTQSEVREHFSRHSREVRLARGEALFDVVHDPTREFIVRTGAWAVLAVGTAFTVRRLNPTSVDITVTEGVVEMLPPRPLESGHRPRLTAFQQASIDGDDRIAVREVSPREMERRLAWRTGFMVFEGQTLREALAEMSRYSRRQLRVEDPELAERSIVGVFPISDTGVFIQGMRATLGVETVESDTTVLLRPRG